MALVTVPTTELTPVSLVLSTTTPSDASMAGLGSFVVFAFLAVALYFLLKNMNARLRRMSYREKEREAAEPAARREADEPSHPGDPGEGPLPPAP